MRETYEYVSYDFQASHLECFESYECTNDEIVTDAQSSPLDTNSAKAQDHSQDREAGENDHPYCQIPSPFARHDELNS